MRCRVHQFRTEFESWRCLTFCHTKKVCLLVIRCRLISNFFFFFTKNYWRHVGFFYFPSLVMFHIFCVLIRLAFMLLWARADWRLSFRIMCYHAGTGALETVWCITSETWVGKESRHYPSHFPMAPTSPNPYHPTPMHWKLRTSSLCSVFYGVCSIRH